MTSTLGSRLKSLREKAGLSAREVDRLAVLGNGKHLTPGHSLYIETNDKPNPTMETLTAIARVFDVSLDWLVDGEGEMPSNEHIRIAVADAHRRAPHTKPAA